jgi:amphi-Trp domain-containing protein
MEESMKDLSFEQKSTVSRSEAADQLAALAQALREGGEAEVELAGGVLSLRIPEELRSEIEFEVGGGDIELEIELKWATGRSEAAAASDEETTPDSERAPAKPASRSTRTSRKTASTSKPRRSGAKRA